MSTNDLSSDTTSTHATKKPYEKPSFRHEQVFVTTAITCGKLSGTQGGCGIVSKVS
jgi:hypothetical protein